MDNREDDTLRCSSCGKSQQEVAELVAGSGTFICNECLDVSVRTSSAKKEQATSPAAQEWRPDYAEAEDAEHGTFPWPRHDLHEYLLGLVFGLVWFPLVWLWRAVVALVAMVAGRGRERR